MDKVSASGTSSFVADMLDQGTRRMTALQIADEWARLGASYEAHAGRDFTIITASGLSAYSEELLAAYAQVITEPAFSKENEERLRLRRLAEIQRLNDEPDHFTDLRADEYLFEDHPYGRSSLGTLRGIKGLKRRDIISFYLTYYRPNNAALAVIGNFDSNIQGQLEKHFAAWSARDVESDVLPVPPPLKDIRIRLVSRPDLQQSQIRVQSLGISRRDPDFLPLQVANTALGGAFASRLMQRIRDDLGLTYSISSSFEALYEPGPFGISTFTANDQVGTTLKETIQILRDFVDKGIRSDEITAAKGQMRGAFARALETPEKLAMNLLALWGYGIGDDYLRNYLVNLEKLSIETVNQAVRRHMTASHLKVLVYGPSEAVLSQIRPIGLVELRKQQEFQ